LDINVSMAAASQATASSAPWNFGRLWKILSGDRACSWADQAAVSLANFIALILIARWGGASEVGIYAVGYSVIVMVLAVQESMITRPYSIHLYHPHGQAKEHAFSSLVMSAILSAAVTVGFAACSLALMGFSAEVATVGWALAVAAPLVLLREFARRFCFAHLKVVDALVLDILVAALNVAILCTLAAMGRLSAATAFLSIGASCGVGGLAWLYLARRQFEPSFKHLSAVIRQSIGLGKWVMFSHLTAHAQGYSSHWLIMSVMGAAATGIYAACLSIVAFANPLIYGFCNILTPRFVRTLQNEGMAGLKLQAARDTLVLVSAMALFCAAVAIGGDQAMRLLYAGSEYQGHAHLLNVLALACLVSAAGVPACTAMTSAQRAGLSAGVTAASALGTVAVVWWCLTQWGLLGAAYGMLVSEAVGSLARWAAFAMMKRPGPGARFATAHAGG
jgi:O-antigen/teichoic acid export membrane protein